MSSGVQSDDCYIMTSTRMLFSSQTDQFCINFPEETNFILHGLTNSTVFRSSIIIVEFATFNDLVLANTFGHHKASRRLTWHSPDEQHHNRVDYIPVRKRFRSGVNNVKTRRFPGADTGSDHDLLMMTLHLRLKRISKPKQTQDSCLTSKSWNIPICWKHSKLW